MNKAFDLAGKIRVHPLFWAVAAIAVATAHFIELLLLLLIIFVHEMGHAAAASYFSWRIRRISLLPFGGAAEVDEHGNRPLKEEAIVLAAGPFQHVWMAAAALALNMSGFLPSYWLDLFLDFNLMVLLFNLLPIWPLDGGKLLFLLLSRKMPFPEAHSQALFISCSLLLVFAAAMLAFAPFTLNTLIIICFLAFSIFFEWKQRRYAFLRFLMERYYGSVHDFRELKPISVHEDDGVMEVLQRFQRGCKHQVIVRSSEGTETRLDENELLHAYFAEKQHDTRIGDIVLLY